MEYDDKEATNQVIISIISAGVYSAFLGDNLNVYKEALNKELYFNFNINSITTENIRTITPTIIFPIIDTFIFALIYMSYLTKVYGVTDFRRNFICLISLSFFPRLSLHCYYLLIQDSLVFYHIMWVIGILLVMIYSFWPWLKNRFSVLAQLSEFISPQTP